MPKQSNKAKISEATKARHKKDVAAKKPRFDKSQLPKFLTQEKVDLLNHPAKRKVYIGGKKTGKTRGTIFKMISEIEGNSDAYGLVFKKYAGNALKRVGREYNTVAMRLQRDYDIPDYHLSIDRSYRMEHSKFNIQKNQSIEYLSFEKISNVAGITAPNGGFYSLIHIEEPVEGGSNEIGKVPDADSWNKDMEIIMDSVERSNEEYNEYNKSQLGFVPVPLKPEIHFTMNPWDDHPIVLEAEEYFPEEEFLEFIEEDYVNNHTMAVYVKENDTLYIRMTKFANPVTQNTPELIEKGRIALETRDKEQMAIIFGMKGITTYGVNTYDMERVVYGEYEDFIKNGYKVMGVSIGWDVDFRRKLVATPNILLQKQNMFTKEIEDRIVLVDDQVVVIGRNHGKIEAIEYADIVSDVSKQIFDKYQSTTEAFIYIDKGQTFVDIVEEKFTTKYRNDVFIAKAVKKGENNHWDILERQDWTQANVDTGFLVFSHGNKPLIIEFGKSIRKPGQKKRDESSTLEKFYDYINSFEYGVYPFHQEQLTKG